MESIGMDKSEYTIDKSNTGCHFSTAVWLNGGNPGQHDVPKPPDNFWGDGTGQTSLFLYRVGDVCEAGLSVYILAPTICLKKCPFSFYYMCIY